MFEAFRDHNTGLFSEEYFLTTLSHEIERAKRYGDYFTLALISIDDFEKIRQGTTSISLPDETLRAMAALIAENTRRVDIAARLEDGVFAMLVIRQDAELAYILTERILLAARKQFQGSLSISIGLASFPRDATTYEVVLSQARVALEQARGDGGNRMFFFKHAPKVAVHGKPVVLVVDDDERNTKLLEALMRPLDYNIIKADGGQAALDIIENTDVDLVLLDVMMPDLDGYEVCKRLKENKLTRLIPVIMVTALDDIAAKIKGIECGADDFLSKPPNKLELIARTKSLINVKRLNDNLASIEEVLFSLANAVEAKDSCTHGHIERVASMAVMLGHKLSLSTAEITALRIGGILHDIGKIGIDQSILNKPGPLNPEEWETMKRHPDIGHRICLPLSKHIGPALDIIRHHHEKIDGSGYPDGIRKPDISQVARIMAVIDIYDALTSERPYRKAMPKDKALAILREEAAEGKLDQDVVGYLIEMIGG
jgi:putative two-component system response regulator